MPGPVLSERDLAVLRSFARRIDPSDAGAHNNLGVLYYQKGLIEDAIAEFVRALELDPRMQVAQSNLDIAYRESGHYDRRITELRERVRRHPEDRDARWELGRAHAALGRHAEAIAEFQALLAWQPSDVPAMLQLGLAEKARGNLDTATDWLARACAQDPASAVARFYHGEVLYNRGLNEPALDVVARRDRAQPRLRRGALPPRLRLRRHGPARGGPRGDQARHQAQPDAGAGPGQSRARALRRGTATGSRPRRAAERPQIVEGGALAHYNLGLAFRQKGLHEEALREYRLALDAGEDRAADPAGDGRGPPAAARAAGGARAVRRARAGLPRLAEALERARRVSAPGGPPRTRRSPPTSAPSASMPATSSRGTTSASSARARRATPAIAAFRRALDGDRPLFAARLNLGLLFLQRRQLRAALEEYQRALAEQSGSAVAWNGVGLVLMELRRFEDARNAFGRAVDADAAMAGARYNLSFVLSQLGDFDGALRETRRALELEPLYVPQKFSLTIDLQYEDPDDRDRARAHGRGGRRPARRGEFAFDPPALDQLFAELAPDGAGGRGHGRGGRRARPGARLHREGPARSRLRRAEPGRRARRAARRHGRAPGRHLRQARPLRRGARALPRGPRRRRPTIPTRRWARSGRCSPSAGPATRRRWPTSSRAGCAATSRCWSPGRASGSRSATRWARSTASARRRRWRPDGPTSSTSRPRSPPGWATAPAALAAFNAALQLDPSLVRVWFELGGIEEERGNWAAARAAYERALDLLPTYGAAALALAELLRRTETPARGDRACWCVCSRPTPTSWRRSRRWAARCWRTAGPTQALEAFERVLRFDPEHAGRALSRGRRARAAAAVRSGGAGVGAGRPARPRRAVRLAGPHARALRARPAAHLRRLGGLAVALEGPLKDLHIQDVFQLLDLGRKSGVLRVTSELRQTAGTVCFDRGGVVAAAVGSDPQPLGARLIRTGKITAADLDRAARMQGGGDGRRLGDILVGPRRHLPPRARPAAQGADRGGGVRAAALVGGLLPVRGGCAVPRRGRVAGPLSRPRRC